MRASITAQHSWPTGRRNMPSACISAWIVLTAAKCARRSAHDKVRCRLMPANVVPSAVTTVPPPARKSLTTSRWPPVPRLAAHVPRNAAKWQRWRSNFWNLSIGVPGLSSVVESVYRYMTAVLKCRGLAFSQSPLSFQDTAMKGRSKIRVSRTKISWPHRPPVQVLE